MDDPIKVIFKFKNNNRRIQYHTYIFVGNAPKNVLKILEEIEDKSLYDSFLHLTPNDNKKLSDQYGEYWYKKIFNTYHINNTIYVIRKTEKQQKELITKYGKEWYKQHIEEFKLVDKKLFYNYKALIKEEKRKKGN